ncbi:MAG: hypothetical protein L0332_34575 [Chloroflexi bacterium]|nr:hypothetical protein [Chloroflexota bacterium]
MEHASAHARAAKVVYLLVQGNALTTAELKQTTGLTDQGLRHLMANISGVGVPIYQPERGHWAILRETAGREHGLG